MAGRWTTFVGGVCGITPTTGAAQLMLQLRIALAAPPSGRSVLVRDVTDRPGPAYSWLEENFGNQRKGDDKDGQRTELRRERMVHDRERRRVLRPAGLGRCRPRQIPVVWRPQPGRSLNPEFFTSSRR